MSDKPEDIKTEKQKLREIKSTAFFPTPFVTRDPAIVQPTESPILEPEFQKIYLSLFPKRYKALHTKFCTKTRQGYLECLNENQKYEKQIHDDIFVNGNFKTLEAEFQKSNEEKCIEELKYYHRCLKEGFKRNMVYITSIACPDELAVFRYSNKERDFKKFEKCCDKVLKTNEKYF